ncbi:restriction endonuclease subunit S [Alphaproteobacteria bacterium]|nr:restriction endonuclease subunit S [Alphaproteobacteria bacterium]
MTSWKKLRIDDLGKVVTGKTPPTSKPEFYGGETQFLTPTDMDGRRTIYKTLRYLSDEGVNKVHSSLLAKGSVSVSCIGSDMGKAVVVGSKTITNQQINSIIVNDEFDNLFVYYNLSGRKEEIQFLASGAAQPIMNKTDFSNLPINVPNIKNQKAIASVLGALDDKIENNHRMNETLEEMARAIFKSWFVDFDPVHAKAAGNAPAHMDAETATLFPSKFGDDGLPEGWKISSLEDFCESVKDGTHASPKSAEVGEYLITTRHIVNGEVDLSNAYKISKEDYEEVNRRSKVDQWDVLISMIGTVGEVCLVRDDPKFAIKNLGLFKSRSRLHGEWLYYFLKSTSAQNHLRASLRGTTQLYIPLGELRTFPCACPPANILNSFGDLACVLSDKIGHNLNENKTLAKLRDTLLPKLMSGEIRVKDAEREVEAAV